MRERAERDSSAHVAAAPERHPPETVRRNLLPAVTELGWLAPRAASLAALGRSPSSAVWSVLRDDPGVILLLLRLPAATQHCRSRKPTFLSLLHDPALPAEALHHLQQTPCGVVDWNEPALHPLYRSAITIARIAEELAIRLGKVDADEARSCGLLAPLGWFAVSAVAPGLASACLGDPGLAQDPAATQRRHWGVDQAALARRLARRWNLPDWITAIVGHLHLPEEQARIFGADTALFHLTRLAIALAQEQGVDLGLGDSAWAKESADALGFSYTTARNLVDAHVEQLPPTVAWESPYQQPLLREVLALAAENGRLRGLPLQQQLEGEFDELQRAFEEQIHGEEQRLQAAKLNALAEFAAGAGHEINNPLAVISGQAQYLLNHQSDWLSSDTEGKTAKALHNIIGQTKRVHALLRDLMLFARPSPAKKAWFDLPQLLGEVAAQLEDFAGQRLVRLEVGRTPEQLPAFADAEQVRIALTCLLKNAIEAAPAEGWARIRVVEPLGEERLEIAVEDSGSGPDADQRDHLFDPFYCGRAAGRGRGLGLPIAWRLLRQQGGTVRLLPSHPQEPTRFVVDLPRVALPAGEMPNAVRHTTAVAC